MHQHTLSNRDIFTFIHTFTSIIGFLLHLQEEEKENEEKEKEEDEDEEEGYAEHQNLINPDVSINVFLILLVNTSVISSCYRCINNYE